MRDRRLQGIVLAVVASVASIVALSWTAAEQGRGLGIQDLRTVLIVALAVGMAAVALDVRRRAPLGRFPFGASGRETMDRAREEAISLGHGYIGTEHLLLALLRDQGTAGRLLSQRKVNLDQARGRIEAIVGRGRESAPTGIALTPRARRVIERASEIALSLGSPRIEGEHLLLGLIEEFEGVAPHVLRQSGVELQELRSAIGRAVGRRATDERPSAESES